VTQTEQENLWPSDLGTTKIAAPSTILKAQGAQLARITQGLLVGIVMTSTLPDSQFAHRFVIEAPTLGYYRYGLLTVRHGIDLYPAEIWWRDEQEVAKARTEQEFVAKLSEVLANDETKRVIS